MEGFRRSTRLPQPAWRPTRARSQSDHARVRQDGAIGQREQVPNLGPQLGSSGLPHVAVLYLRAIGDRPKRVVPGWEYLWELWPAHDPESRPFLHIGAGLHT